MKEMRILSPTGIVGYGFPEESFFIGISQNPDLIACDAGSTDPGPYYLGSGCSFTTRSAVKRDLTLMIKAACDLNIPLIIGTSGGAGGNSHLNREKEIVFEIAKEQKLSFSFATVSAEINKEYLIEELEKGNLLTLGAAPLPREEDINSSTRIVAQMGVESIISALDKGAQVIFCGRCYDPAPFAAPAIRNGFSEALATHLGKLLECACISATPGSGSDCMMGYLYEDSFSIEPCTPNRRCTITSVAAHTLYEKSNPYLLPGPGGTLDLRECTFIQETERRVRVSGSKFLPQKKKNVKLEGARKIGYRTICICGNRDPIFIKVIETTIENLKRRTAENLEGVNFSYTLDFVVYGKNGVMGNLEPYTQVTSHEIGIVIDVVADSQEHANTVCSVARSTLLHYGYEGRKSTAGNLAFPYSPSDIEVGGVYEFSVYCLLENYNSETVFPIEFGRVQYGENNDIS